MIKGIKIKNEYLVITLLLFLAIVSYEFAIKKTIALVAAHNEMISSLANSEKLSYQPDYIMRKNKNLDKILNKYKADTTAIRDTIVTAISTIAARDNIEISELPARDVSFNNSHYIIQRFNFEGTYVNLVKLLNQLQLYNGIGVLRSVEWRNTSAKILLDEQPKLLLKIYLEISK